MKKLSLVLVLMLIGVVACTPAEDNTLPTRVVLPMDDVVEQATDFVVDPLETATESVIDPLETATESVIDPLETATESVIDPLETATESVIDPLETQAVAVASPAPVQNSPSEQATDFVIDPLEAVTESVIDPLNPPIVIPPLQQTQPPTATSETGLNVVMPTFDLTNLPTSIPTATPYPMVENFATVAPSTQIVRLRGTVEVFIEPVRSDDIYLLKDANGVAIELLWDINTIDYIPSKGQVIEAIGVIETSRYGNSPLFMQTQSIIPITAVDETDM